MKASLTLSAIDKAIRTNAEKGHRRHLGASIIGRPCSREIWYKFRWVSAEDFDARMLRLFNRGHLEELRFVKWLQDAGIEVWQYQDDGKTQFRISDHHGHFGGSLDGVVRGLPDLKKDQPALLEFKTHSGKSFAKLLTEGLVKAKWEHYVQMQTYMYKMGLTVGLYCAINKDTDDLHLELVGYDERTGKNAIQRAGKIIFSYDPPERIAENPSHPTCKFCHFQKLCHFGKGLEVERNCRTCKWGGPDTKENGEWICTNPENETAAGNSITLDEEAQRKGCENYCVKDHL